MDRIDLEGLVLSALTAVGGGVMWLIRRVLTNQKQIEMLQAEIKHRDTLRQEDREDMREVRDDVKALRHDLQEMFRK